MNKVCNKCKISKPVSEFYKDKSRLYGVHSHCKQCHGLYRKRWNDSNRDKLATASIKYKESWGYGVYEVLFPSGRYIGSGQLKSRRNDHVWGRSSIAKSLNEKAIEFNILLVCDKDNCRFYEQQVIDMFGIDAILNSIPAVKVVEDE